MTSRPPLAQRDSVLYLLSDVEIQGDGQRGDQHCVQFLQILRYIHIQTAAQELTLPPSKLPSQTSYHIYFQQARG